MEEAGDETPDGLAEIIKFKKVCKKHNVKQYEKKCWQRGKEIKITATNKNTVKGTNKCRYGRLKYCSVKLQELRQIGVWEMVKKLTKKTWNIKKLILKVRRKMITGWISISKKYRLGQKGKLGGLDVETNRDRDQERPSCRD